MTLRHVLFRCIVTLGMLFATGAASAKDLKVLCLGDSLTEGLGVAPDDAWPSVLEKELRAGAFPGIKLVNAGISGATAASGPGRLKWHLKGEGKPDVLILELGANDGLRGQDVAAMKKALQEAIRAAKAAGVKVLLAGMMVPTNYGKEYALRFEAAFAELAKEEDVPLIPFFLAGVAADPKLNQADGIHPNATGHKIVAATVKKHLEPLLKP